MTTGLSDTLGPVQERWRALPSVVRLLVVLALVATVIAGAATYAMNTVFLDYQVLFRDLSQEDLGAIVEALRAARVPHRVADGGQVLVPAAQVHEWRLQLASRGLPSGGSVGFEIFDKSQFGLTDFSQRLNYQRALQGELARTIGQLREVQQARVHLALPTPRVFSSQDKAPSASVVLRLRPGAVLRAEQVRGIVHLVTSAVEGLTSERVTVVDASGRALASGQDQLHGLTATQRETRTLVEQDVERRIQGLLEPIVGSGHSAVRVAALISFDQIERTQERIDPSPVLRSRTRSTESSQGTTSQPVPAGPERDRSKDRDRVKDKDKDKDKEPDPDRDPVAASTTTSRSQRENEQTTFEVARTVERTVVTPGEVKRLSVAVLLDVPVVNGNRAPRTDEDLDRLKRLVASAAGIRADRGDELEVLQVPFDPALGVQDDKGPVAPAPAPAGPEPLWKQRVVWIWGGGALGALVVMTLVLMTLRARRGRRVLLNAVTAALEAGPQPAAVAGAGVRQGAVSAPAAASAAVPATPIQLKTDEVTLRERLAVTAREHPEEMVQIIRAWMYRQRAMAS